MENMYANKSDILIRPSFNEKAFEEKYTFKPVKSTNVLSSTKNYFKKYYTPSKDCCTSFLLDRLPFIKWLMVYSVRDNLLKDIIGGLTIGVVQIPQSI